MKIRVVEHVSGKELGLASLSDFEVELYARGEHPEFRWPQGTARAAEVLDAEDIAQLDIDPTTVIRLE